MQNTIADWGENFRKNKALIGTALTIVLCYVTLELLGITCPIRFLTGISCAGCGMSRAWLAVFRLDFASAFAFHPLFWLPVPAAVLFFLRKRIPQKTVRGTAIGMIVLFLAVYLLRMFDPGDSIVTFDPAESLFYKIFIAVRSLIRV